MISTPDFAFLANDFDGGVDALDLNRTLGTGALEGLDEFTLFLLRMGNREGDNGGCGDTVFAPLCSGVIM